MNTIAKSKTVDRVINTCVYDFEQIRAGKKELHANTHEKRELIVMAKCV